MPLCTSQQFIEGQDLRLVDVAPEEFKRLIHGPIDSTFPSKVGQVSSNEELARADQIRVLTSLRPVLIFIREPFSDLTDR